MVYSLAVDFDLGELVGILEAGDKETVGSEFALGLDGDERTLWSLYGEFGSSHGLAVGHCQGERAAVGCSRHIHFALCCRCGCHFKSLCAGEFHSGDEVKVTAYELHIRSGCHGRRLKTCHFGLGGRQSHFDGLAALEIEHCVAALCHGREHNFEGVGFDFCRSHGFFHIGEADGGHLVHVHAGNCDFVAAANSLSRGCSYFGGHYHADIRYGYFHARCRNSHNGAV